MAKDYDYPSYDAGGRVKKEKVKDPNKDLDYGGKNPGYQEYLDKQDFGKAFNLTKEKYGQFEWRGKVYNTKEKK